MICVIVRVGVTLTFAMRVRGFKKHRADGLVCGCGVPAILCNLFGEVCPLHGKRRASLAFARLVTGPLILRAADVPCNLQLLTGLADLPVTEVTGV